MGHVTGESNGSGNGLWCCILRFDRC